MKNVTRLTFIQGASNKEYNVSVSGDDDTGYTVSFSYGRIGSALVSSTKTPSPVSKEQAEKIAEKLIKAKVKKGYQFDESGVVGSIPVMPIEPVNIEFSCQLSNPVSIEEMVELMKFKQYAAQTKFDGVRKVVFIEDGKVTATNRRGVATSINPAFIPELLNFGKKATLDTEDMGDHLRIFDVLNSDGESLLNQPFFYRAVELSRLAIKHNSEIMRFVDTVMIQDVEHLKSLVAKNRADGEEGLILRELQSDYTAGRPSKLGSSLKIKNTNDLSCLVIAQEADGKRSVQLGLIDDDGSSLVHVGNVTIPVNHSIPMVGDVLDVNYLWSLAKDGGKLIQPVFKRVRTEEIPAEDCTKKQIVYKNPASSEWVPY